MYPYHVVQFSYHLSQGPYITVHYFILHSTLLISHSTLLILHSAPMSHTLRKKCFEWIIPQNMTILFSLMILIRSQQNLRDFCEIYSCKNLIKDNTCFKNPSKPSCIDLIITNRPKRFQNSVTVENGLSDFHKMTLQ